MIGFQKQLRAAVEAEQVEISKMSDRAYKKFVRELNRSRFDMFKNEEKARSEKAQERAQASKRTKVMRLLLK